MQISMKILSLLIVILLVGCVNLAPSFTLPDSPVSQAINTHQQEKTSSISLKAWQDFFPNENTRALIALAYRTIETCTSPLQMWPR